MILKYIISAYSLQLTAYGYLQVREMLTKETMNNKYFPTFSFLINKLKLIFKKIFLWGLIILFFLFVFQTFLRYETIYFKGFPMEKDRLTGNLYLMGQRPTLFTLTTKSSWVLTPPHSPSIEEDLEEIRQQERQR